MNIESLYYYMNSNTTKIFVTYYKYLSEKLLTNITWEFRNLET